MKIQNKTSGAYVPHLALPARRPVPRAPVHAGLWSVPPAHSGSGPVDQTAPVCHCHFPPPVDTESLYIYNRSITVTRQISPHGCFTILFTL